jgi:pimeloyl-ACP methyl ester carboxylesterase
MPIITTRDDVRLHVKVWGRGRPVILIHGWPLSADSWDAQAWALAESGYKVIAYDRRGFGRSEQPWGGYDYDTLSDDLADVMQACGAAENATLAGFSMGGGEVARYMSRHGGGGVSSIALVSSVVPRMMKGDDNPAGVPASTFDAMTQGMKADRPRFMRQFLADFFGQGLIVSSVSAETVDWAWRLCMQAGLKPTLACAEAFATTDFRHDVAQIAVPTLVIHGTADATVPIDATGRQAAQAIPGARLIEYAGAPHGLFATHQEKLTRDLLNFLADPASARS